MGEDRFSEVGALFDALVDVPHGERDAELAKRTADPDLRLRVRALLAADDRAEAFGPRVVALRDAAVKRLGGDEESRMDGQVFGGWRVGHELGRGGMGRVLYVERDADGTRQRGALKLIRSELDGAEVIARFDRERRLLALLDHPNIARFMDAGTTDAGRPWLVMEFVDGEPLLAWCAQRRAGVEDRLRLFLQVCAAVRLAHRQSVVHRDLKPSNVLVTADGVAKLLDFGIAKVLDDADAGFGGDSRPPTRDAPLTPYYASPEQLRGLPADTLTDVYGLGATLHELLTGRRAYASVDAPAPADWLRILDGPPCTPPSLAAVGAPAETRVAPARLRGDLDTIVLKAVAREPERRYASVDALIEDVERHLRGAPILARGDDWSYRLGRLVARHRGVAAAIAVAVLSLVGASLFSLRAAHEARIEAERATAAQRYLLSLFEASDPELAAAGYRLEARDLVELGAKRLEREYAGQPDARADLSLLIGRILHRLGEARAAVVQLGWEDTLPSPLAGHERRRDQRLWFLAEAQSASGDYSGAERSATQLLRRAERSGSAVFASRAERALAQIARSRGDRAAAVALARRALVAAQDSGSTTDRVEAAFAYADVLRESGEVERARAEAERTLALCEQRAGECGLRLPQARIQLAGLQAAQGATDAAAGGLSRALVELDRWLPEAHPVRADALAQLAAIDSGRGAHEQAVERARLALSLLQRSTGGDSVEVGGYTNGLGARLSAAGRHAEALAAYDDAVAMFGRLGLDEHPYALAARSNRAMVLGRLGREAESLDAAREALAISRRALGPRAMSTVQRMVQLATLLRRAGRHDEARGLAVEARDVLEGPDAPVTLVAIDMLIDIGNVLSEGGASGDALALLERVVARIRALPEPSPLRLCEALSSAADALRLAGKTDDALDRAREAVAIAERADRAGNDGRAIGARVALAQVLATRADGRAQARDLLRAAVDALVHIEGAEGPRARRVATILAAIR